VGVRVCIPLVANMPLQLPEAVQLVAPEDDHVIVVEVPTAIDCEPRFSAGGLGAGTVTVNGTTAAGDMPIALAHVSVYASLPPAVGVTIWRPLGGSTPLQLPDAVQLVAVEEDQVMVAELPKTMEFELIKRAGAAGATSVRLTELVDAGPTLLVQVSE
jgi:hypothetical protein